MSRRPRVFARQQPLDLVLPGRCGEKLARYLAIQRPVAVIGERRGVPHRVLNAGRAGRHRSAQATVAPNGTNKTPVAPWPASRPDGIEPRPIGEYSLPKFRQRFERGIGQPAELRAADDPLVWTQSAKLDQVRIFPERV